MRPGRRTVLAGGLAALAAPRLALADAPDGLRAAAPDWLTIRLAVPNRDGAGYASYAALAGQAHRFVSENLTKTGFTVPAPQPGVPAAGLAVDFARFEAQRAALAAAGGDRFAGTAPEFDLHGAFWHQSLSPAIVDRLEAAPEDWPVLLAHLHETHVAAPPIAGGPLPRFDINEVQRALRPEDLDHAYWRGPSDTVRNGSPWYRAAARAPDAHGPGWWWLGAARGPAAVIYQDFDLEAGRPWGAGGAEVPPGQQAALPEMLKRRRILDAVGYALAHGARIDVMGLQAHLAPWRAVDETDLGLFLDSLAGLGVVPEVTELDMQTGDGGAGRGGPDPVAYGRALLGWTMARTPMQAVGGWTGWAPQGQPPRLTMVAGGRPAPLGLAVIEAARDAGDPAGRPAPAALRFYQLCFGVTGELWRAAGSPAAPGFEAEGNARGTRVAAGSGGAALPLDNRDLVPGGPVAPVWRDPDGTVAQTDPAALSLAFQWAPQGRGGRGEPILSLVGVDGAAAAGVGLRDGHLWLTGGDGAAADLGPLPRGGDAVVALSWERGRIAACSSAAVAEAALAAEPARAILLGDGRREGTGRATCLTLWRAPAAGAETLRARAAPLGARFLAVG